MKTALYFAYGSNLDAAQMRERTAAVLHGRFATVCTVAEALSRAA